MSQNSQTLSVLLPWCMCLGILINSNEAECSTSILVCCDGVKENLIWFRVSGPFPVAGSNPSQRSFLDRSWNRHLNDVPIAVQNHFLSVNGSCFRFFFLSQLWVPDVFDGRC